MKCKSASYFLFNFLLFISYLMETRAEMDRTFWSETLDPGNARQNPVLAIGIQSDGSIVLGGTAIRCSGAEEPNALFRLKSDGTYDPNFNFHESMVEQYQVRSLLILQDDRIVACVKDKFGWHKPSLRVFGQNGEPMGTFGDYPLNAEVDAMLPLEGTGIYLVAREPNLSKFFSTDGSFSPIVRLTWEGTLDEGFHPDALLRTLSIADVKIGNDGSLYVVTASQTSAFPSLMRFDETGRRDVSFDCSFQAESIFGFQGSGKLIVRLQSGEIVRLRTDGSLDDTFSTQSSSPNLFDSYPVGHVFADDSIWFGAYAERGDAYHFMGTNLSADGQLQGEPMVLPGDVPSRNAACVVQEDDHGRLLVSYNAVRHTVRPLSPGLVRLLPSAGLPSHPVVYNQKEIIQLRAGERLILKVRASGSPLYFEWYHNGVPLPGQTEAALDILDIPPERSGVYSVRVRNELGETEVVMAEVDVVFFSFG